MAPFLTFSSLSLCLIIVLGLHGAYAVDYTVDNQAATTPGGIRFTNEYGVERSKQTLASATEFIWSTFGQASPADRKDVQGVPLIIEDKDGVAYTVNNEVHLSAQYVNGISPGNVVQEVTGVLYHEMTHVWQWNGNGKPTPGGLIEGIADYVRLKAGYIPGHWVKPGGGDRWDQGYDVTARFLEYCEGLRGGFVAELNKRMRSDYDVNYFVDLLGKMPEDLFRDYKATYAM